MNQIQPLKDSYSCDPLSNNINLHASGTIKRIYPDLTCMLNDESTISDSQGSVPSGHTMDNENATTGRNGRRTATCKRETGNYDRDSVITWTRKRSIRRGRLDMPTGCAVHGSTRAGCSQTCCGRCRICRLSRKVVKQYLIKHAGWDAKHNIWEPECNLHPSLIEQFGSERRPKS